MIFTKKEKQPAEEQMPIIEHLLALRKALVKIVIGLIITLIALSPFMQDIFNYSLEPLLSSIGQETKLLSIGVIAPVLVPLKVLAFSAFCLSFPHTLYQIWAYVAPGLYLNEKRYALLFIISSLLMFMLGVAYCQFVVFGFLFEFINSFAGTYISFAPDIDAYISFVLHMFFAFGFAFEMPVVVVLLALSGIASIEALKHFFKYIVVIAFVISAIITPPDIASQLLLAIPLILLYLVGIMLSALFLRRDGKNNAVVEESI